MLRTLYARLATALVALFVAIGLSYALISTSASRQYLQELTQSFNRDLAKRIVADCNLVAEGRLDGDALRDTFSAYMEINPSIEIYLLDPEGTILAYSAPPGKVKLNAVRLEPVKRFLQGPGDLPVTGDDPRNPRLKKAFSAAPSAGITTWLSSRDPASATPLISSTVPAARRISSAVMRRCSRASS